MTIRGPKPQSTAMRLLRNNPGKRSINKEEPIPDALETEVPEEISTDIGRAEWTRTIVPAINRGQITAADRSFAIAHCELWATWRDQITEANRHPNIVAVGPNKHPMPNPARGMANKTLLLLARVDVELGLTPSSRSRVKADKSKASKLSPVEAFRQKKRA